MEHTSQLHEACRRCGGTQAPTETGRALTLLVCTTCGRCHVEQQRGLAWSRVDFQIAAAYYRSLTEPSPARRRPLADFATPA